MTSGLALDLFFFRCARISLDQRGVVAATMTGDKTGSIGILVSTLFFTVVGVIGFFFGAPKNENRVSPRPLAVGCRSLLSSAVECGVRVWICAVRRCGPR